MVWSVIRASITSRIMTPIYDTVVLTLLLVVVPAVLGAICGLQVYGRLSDLLFARAVNLTFLGAGFAMLV